MDHDTGDGDNEDVMLLPPSLLAKTIMFSLPPIWDEFMTGFKDCQEVDETVLEVLGSKAAKESTALTASLKQHWSVKDGLVFYSGHLYVANDTEVCGKLVSLHDDVRSAGDAGCLKTLDLL